MARYDWRTRQRIRENAQLATWAFLTGLVVGFLIGAATAAWTPLLDAVLP